MIYANAAGTSWPKPAPVVAAAHEALLADPRGNADRYRQGHAAVRRFFGIPESAAERLLLAPSCTAALAVAIADLVWEEGDVVVTSSLEHHALARPVQKLVWERGVVHAQAPYSPGAPIDLEFVEARLKAGGVKLVAVNGASNVTGERLPVAELASLAHAHGALLLLDAAQLAGVTPLDVTALGVDLLTFAGHKAMQGPLGIGGLWAAPHVRFTCPTATCEVGGVDGGRSSPFPGFCDLGSVNFPALAGLAAAVAWLGERSPEERARPVVLAERLHHQLAQRPGCRVLGGAGPRTATVSMLLDRLPVTRAQAHFAERGLVVRAGAHCAPMALAAVGAPEGCVRVSFGPHNQPADVDAVLAAVDDLA